MNKTTQRAVIIDNISSPYIEQAIIILKDFSHSNRDKVISDAEKIVRDYLEKLKTDDSDITIYNRPSSKHKNNKSKSAFNTVLLYVGITAAVCTAAYILFL